MTTRSMSSAQPPSPLRILHCPEIIGGHAPALAAAERELGLDSRCVALRPHPFEYSSDEVLSGGGRLGVEWARWRLLLRALRGTDVVHFNFGMSTMPQRTPLDTPWDTRQPIWLKRVYNVYACTLELRDLGWLRRAGKRIVVSYQGDDARQAEALRRSCEIHPGDEAGYHTTETDRLKRERIEVVGQLSDAIFALNPDLLRVLPGGSRFLPYAIPAVATVNPVGVSRAGGLPVLAHAPSHQGVKGTRFVLDAVQRLRQEGVQFEFKLIEGVPHNEAMRLYAGADLLVDQLLVGWYGGVAVEVMALGKPVVAYIRESDLQFLPSEMSAALPIISATPATLHDVLRHWLRGPRDALVERGRSSRAFVERWHHPRAVAETTRDTYLAISRSSEPSGDRS